MNISNYRRVWELTTEDKFCAWDLDRPCSFDDILEMFSTAKEAKRFAGNLNDFVVDLIAAGTMIQLNN